MENNFQLNKIFNSVDLNHQISISIIDNVSWFNINKLNYESYKTFLLLLKEVLTFMNIHNIKYVKQYIYKEDLEYFKNSSYVEIGDSQYTVTTDIIYFLSEITNVLGIQKI